MRSARGQGTVEYLAVVLLVAFALGGGTAAVASAAGADIATAVPHEVLRALCIVSGGDCDRDRAPCDVDSDSRARSWAVTIAVVKLGHDKRVTVTPPLGRHVRGDARDRAHRRRRGERRRAGEGRPRDEAASPPAPTSPSARPARSLAAARGSSGPRLKPTASCGRSRSTPCCLRRQSTGTRRPSRRRATPAIGTIANASGGVLAGLAGGWEADRRTGNRTYFLSGSVGGQADASVKGSKVAASVAGSDSDRYALTVAPDGRWIDLAVTRTGELGTSVALPKDVAAALGTLDLPGSPPRRWVTDSHLDLADPAQPCRRAGLRRRAQGPASSRPAHGRDRRAFAADA